MEEIIKTSYSALQTFKQCPQKYKFQYVDKIRAPKSKEAVFGNKIHKALQFFHSKQPISPTLDELLNYLKDIWDSTPFQNQEEDMIYFSEAIKLLKNYYNHYLKIKDKFTVIDTEIRFEVKLEKCRVAGIIDRIDKTKDGIEIIDYKTTKRLPSQQDIDNNLQLSIYCLGLINRWPQFAKQGLKNIKLSFYYLKHQEIISTQRTQEELDSLRGQILEQLAEIDKSNFKPIPSPLCDWCGYKNICPMWKHKFIKPETYNTEQINKIIKEFLELKENNQKNNKRLSKLKDIINDYLNQEGLERVFGETGYITRLSQTRHTYDINKIKKILQSLNKWKEISISKEYKILKATHKKNGKSTN